MTWMDGVTMVYHKDEENPEETICIWKIDGVEKFRHRYKDMLVHAAIYSTDYRIAERIIQWAKMLHNPD